VLERHVRGDVTRWASGFRHLSRLGDDLSDELINPFRVAPRAPDPSRKITRTGTTEKSRDTSGRSGSQGPQDKARAPGHMYVPGLA
jgi:hypothetical protein